MVGIHNSYQLDASKFEGDSNSFLYDTTVALIDEVHKNLAKKTRSRIKLAITETYVDISDKWVVSGMRPSFTNLLFYSNQELDAVYLERNDRRFWIYRWYTKPSRAAFKILSLGQRTLKI